MFFGCKSALVGGVVQDRQPELGKVVKKALKT